jgi:HK97 gp10 family phage protein
MINIEVDKKEYESSVDKFISSLKSDTKDWLKESADQIIKDAQKDLYNRFERHTGRAGESIKVTEKTDDSITIDVDDNVAPYAKYLSEGTEYIDGYPFLEVASKSNESSIVSNCEKLVEKAISESGF